MQGPNAFGGAKRRVRRVIRIPYSPPKYLSFIVALLHICVGIVVMSSLFSTVLICCFCTFLFISFLWVRHEIYWLYSIAEVCFDRNGWALIKHTGESVDLAIAGGLGVRPFVSSHLIVLPVREDKVKQTIYRRFFPRAIFFCSLWVAEDDLRQLRVLLWSSSVMASESELS